MSEGFTSVTSSNPCPHCGKGKWCMVAPNGARICYRVGAGGVEKTDKHGQPYRLFRAEEPARPLADRTTYYPYRDEKNEPHRAYVKFEKADGTTEEAQAKPDGAGGWKFGKGAMKGRRALLYRLPELLDPTRAAEPVYWCEGEKTADALAARGLLATCTPGGSKGNVDWKELQKAGLAGRHIILCPDRDDDGTAYIKRVRQKLNLVGPASVCVLECPLQHKGADLADWLHAKRGRAELEALPVVTWAEWLGAQPEPEAPQQPEGILLGSTRNFDLPTVVALALAALVAANVPPTIFNFGGLLARVWQGAVKLLCHASLTTALAASTPWRTKTAKGEASCIPPGPVVASLLVALEYPAGIPPLEQVTSLPTITREGDLVATPGYHPNARLFLDLNPELVGIEVPDDPSPAEIARAVEVLGEAFQDFPFKGAADRAHTFAATLQPIGRDLIQGPTPLFMVEAPMRASGKDLLIQACCLSSAGQMTWSTDVEEQRKSITTALLGGSAYIHLANLKGKLDSAPLETVLTCTTWTDRAMKTQQGLHLPNRATWLASANNPQVSEDLARRIVTIGLDARHENPALRTGFRIRHLELYLRRNRRARVQAALTLWKAYLRAGRPLWQGKAPGSFESWAGVLGGLLEVAGVPGFLVGWRDRLEERSSDRDQFRAFVLAWAEELGPAVITVKDLAEKLCVKRQFKGAMEEPCLSDLRAAHPENHAFKVALGRLLAENAGRVFGGWSLTRAAQTRTGVSQWELCMVLGGDPAQTQQGQTLATIGTAGSAGDAGSVSSLPPENSESNVYTRYACTGGRHGDPADPANGENGLTTPKKAAGSMQGLDGLNPGEVPL